MPFGAEEWQYYTEQAASISDSHPIDKTKVKPGQFMEWAKESLKLAMDTVYDGFEPNVTPSEAYKARALPLLEKRMHYGSERLARLVADIYSSKPTSFLQ